MATVVTVSLTGNPSVYAIGADAVVDANSYLGARIGSDAWSSASSSDKKKALVSAARFIDRAVSWSGKKTVSSQPLQWPRDGATCDSESVTDGTIPDEFAYAEFEMALILLGDSAAQDSTGTGSNIKSVKAGSARVEFFSSSVGSSSDTRLPTTVNDLVGCYIDGSVSFGSSSSGTSETSSFDCDDDYNRTRGYP